MPEPIYRFGPFRLDTGERRLLRGNDIVPVRGKVFDTLCVLVENHGHLVRKAELIGAVWPDSTVAENNLDQNVSTIRKVLGRLENGGSYIETVPRQGYRFVAPVEPLQAAASGRHRTGGTGPAPPLAEREEQRLQLRAALELAASGHRQLVLVTGEAGVGKTALVRAFEEEAAALGRAQVAHGECQKHYGQGEPYMPVLEALGRLARDDDGLCSRVLGKHAPSWLPQLPSARARLRSAPPPPGMTAERMLREMAEAIEFLTAERKLVLVLEDLHWADCSTVDLLARLGQRTEQARLLVVGTYRPADARARSHPIQEAALQLKLRGCSREIRLGALTAGGVVQYVEGRFGGVLPAAVAHRLHSRTGGNPLFLATVLRSWQASGSVQQSGDQWRLAAEIEELSFAIPDDLRQLIEEQLAELAAADREVLEAASVAGTAFCPAAIAPALDRPVSEVEADCAALVSDGRFLEAAGLEEWPDGTVCDSYTFLSSVHRGVVYERLPAGRRVRLHEAIATRIEAGHPGREDAIAAELAMHFREARDAPRALRYLRCVAEQSLMASAHREAIEHLTAALGMLARLPEFDERSRHERDLLALLAPALVITRGFADPEAERAFRRAYELSTQLDGPRAHFPVVFGLAVMLEIRGQYPNAQRLIERHLPEQERCGTFVPESRDLLACSRFHQGAFADALAQADLGAQAYSPDKHSMISAALGEDPGIDCHGWAALALWFLGYPDQAVARARLAVLLAQDPSRTYSLANARIQLATLHQLRGEEAQTLEWADQAIALAAEQGYSYRSAAGQVLRGWALARLGESDEGVRALQEGMNACMAAGARLDRPYHLALLAEAFLLAGRPGEAAAVLDDAVAGLPPNFFYTAELQRLRGLAALQCGCESGIAEGWLLRALEVAASQAALSLELRASLNLAEMGAPSGRKVAARARVSARFSRFTEGFETPDLRRAARFLNSRAARQGG